MKKYICSTMNLLTSFFVNTVSVKAMQIELPGQTGTLHVGEDAKNATNDALVKLFNDGYVLFQGFCGLLAMFGVAVFIFLAFRLGSETNPNKRAEAIKQLGISLLCTALVGGMPLIMTLIINLLAMF